MNVRWFMFFLTKGGGFNILRYSFEGCDIALKMLEYFYIAYCDEIVRISQRRKKES